MAFERELKVRVRWMVDDPSPQIKRALDKAPTALRIDDAQFKQAMARATQTIANFSTELENANRILTKLAGVTERESQRKTRAVKTTTEAIKEQTREMERQAQRAQQLSLFQMPGAAPGAPVPPGPPRPVTQVVGPATTGPDVQRLQTAIEAAKRLQASPFPPDFTRGVRDVRREFETFVASGGKLTAELVNARNELERILAIWRRNEAQMRRPTVQVAPSERLAAQFTQRFDILEQMRAGGATENRLQQQSKRVLDSLTLMRGEAARAGKSLGDMFGPDVMTRVNQFQSAMRASRFEIELFGDRIPIGRMAAWAVGFTVLYRAIQQVIDAIRALTLGSIQRFAELQTRTLQFAAIIATINPEVPFNRAVEGASALIRAVDMMAPRFLGSREELELMLLATLQWGLATDLSSRKAQEDFLVVANAIKFVTIGMNQTVQAAQELRLLAEGQLRPQAQLLSFLRAIDPRLREHLKLWREQGTTIENVAQLLRGQRLALEAQRGTIEQQLRALENMFRLFQRGAGGPTGTFIGFFLRILTSIPISAIEPLGAAFGGAMLVGLAAGLARGLPLILGFLFRFGGAEAAGRALGGRIGAGIIGGITGSFLNLPTILTGALVVAAAAAGPALIRALVAALGRGLVVGFGSLIALILPAIGARLGLLLAGLLATANPIVIGAAGIAIGVALISGIRNILNREDVVGDILQRSLRRAAAFQALGDFLGRPEGAEFLFRGGEIGTTDYVRRLREEQERIQRSLAAPNVQNIDELTQKYFVLERSIREALKAQEAFNRELDRLELGERESVLRFRIETGEITPRQAIEEQRRLLADQERIAMEAGARAARARRSLRMQEEGGGESIRERQLQSEADRIRSANIQIAARRRLEEINQEITRAESRGPRSGTEVENLERLRDERLGQLVLLNQATRALTQNKREQEEINRLSEAEAFSREEVKDAVADDLQQREKLRAIQTQITRAILEEKNAQLELQIIATQARGDETAERVLEVQQRFLNLLNDPRFKADPIAQQALRTAQAFEMARAQIQGQLKEYSRLLDAERELREVQIDRLRTVSELTSEAAQAQIEAGDVRLGAIPGGPSPSEVRISFEQRRALEEADFRQRRQTLQQTIAELERSRLRDPDTISRLIQAYRELIQITIRYGMSVEQTSERARQAIEQAIGAALDRQVAKISRAIDALNRMRGLVVFPADQQIDLEVQELEIARIRAQAEREGRDLRPDDIRERINLLERERRIVEQAVLLQGEFVVPGMPLPPLHLRLAEITAEIEGLRKGTRSMPEDVGSAVQKMIDSTKPLLDILIARFKELEGQKVFNVEAAKTAMGEFIDFLGGPFRNQLVAALITSGTQSAEAYANTFIAIARALLRSGLENLLKNLPLPGGGGSTGGASGRAGGGSIPRSDTFMLHEGEFVLPRHAVDRLGGASGIAKMLAAMGIETGMGAENGGFQRGGQVAAKTVRPFAGPLLDLLASRFFETNPNLYALFTALASLFPEQTAMEFALGIAGGPAGKGGGVGKKAAETPAAKALFGKLFEIEQRAVARGRPTVPTGGGLEETVRAARERLAGSRRAPLVSEQNAAALVEAVNKGSGKLIGQGSEAVAYLVEVPRIGRYVVKHWIGRGRGIRGGTGVGGQTIQEAVGLAERIPDITVPSQYYKDPLGNEYVIQRFVETTQAARSALERRFQQIHAILTERGVRSGVGIFDLGRENIGFGKAPGRGGKHLQITDLGGLFDIDALLKKYGPEAVAAFYERMGLLQKLKGFIPGRELGGPISQTGPHMLHAGEFVLSRQLVDAMRTSGGGGGTVFNLNGVNVTDLLSPQAQSEIAGILRNQAPQAILTPGAERFAQRASEKNYQSDL